MAKKNRNITEDIRPELLEELNRLDKEFIEANGIKLKPSQCYRIEANKVLFNTNCPEQLKHKVTAIVGRYKS